MAIPFSGGEEWPSRKAIDGVVASALIRARFFDTVLGCLVGLVGGICLHSPRFRDLAGSHLRRLLPSRLLP